MQKEIQRKDRKYIKERKKILGKTEISTKIKTERERENGSE